MMNQSPFLAGSYVSAHGRASATKILLAALSVVNLVSMIAIALTLAFPPITEEMTPESNVGGIVVSLIAGGVGILTIALYIGTVVVFCMWLYRSANNVKAFGTPPSQIEYSPGWAVGSFFVPFANLVIPFRAVKEVWRNSQPAAESLFAVDPPALFTIWWIFWLLSNFANNIYLRVGLNERTDRELSVALGVGADALTIIAGILAILVVSEIDKRQEEASRSMNMGSFGSPIPPPPPNFG